jgi:hypothetical protein
MIQFKLSPKRCFYRLNDRRDGIFKLTPASRAEVMAHHQCPGTKDWACPYLSPHWHEQPAPIHVIVNSLPSKLVSMTDVIIDLTILHKDVLEVLAQHCQGICCGNVILDSKTTEPQTTHFVTVAMPKRYRIQSDRGRNCRHKYFACCGVFSNHIGWAKGAIVERTLDDRQVYVDQDGWILVADKLVEDLALKERFPSLWLEPIPVVPEPLDGESLPGDPDWDGVLRRKYPAYLGIVVSVPYPPPHIPDRQREREIFNEFKQRLDKELAALGAEEASRDKGAPGSCGFDARGRTTASLKEAVLHALEGWRVRATFSVTLHDYEREGDTLVEQFKVSGAG